MGTVFAVVFANDGHKFIWKSLDVLRKMLPEKQMYYNFACSGKYTGIFPNLPKIDIVPVPMPNTKKYVATTV